MKAEGYYKLARPSGGRCTFAAVRIAVEKTQDPTTIVIADSDRVAGHYISAAKTGIQYAQDQLILEGQNPPSVNVTILEIQETPADTLPMYVVYAACRAYCDAIGMSLKRPIVFNDSDHLLSFPQGRPG